MRNAWLGLALVGAILTTYSLLVSIAISFDQYALGYYSPALVSSPDARDATSSGREARLGVAAALLFNPLDASYWYHRYLFLGGNVCRRGGQPCDTAVESLRHAVNGRPYWALAWAGLAAALSDRGSGFEESNRALERALRFGPYESQTRLAVLKVGLIDPDRFVLTRRSLFAGAVLSLLENGGKLLVTMAQQHGQTQWLANFFGTLGRREQFDAMCAKHQKPQAVAQ